MRSEPTLGEVVAVLDELYDPGQAESWDAVGLVLGDPEQRVSRVLFAVDPADAVVDEARRWKAELLVTHHPLFLRGVHGIAATTPKGRRAHRLVRAGIALHTVHTNADVADPGVSDALAASVGLVGVTPLQPQPDSARDKLVTFVPEAAADALIDALAAAGAGAIGAYTRCAWTTNGVGTFRPEPGAAPAIGAVGSVEAVAERRVEMVLPRTRRYDVVAALRDAHPYEEPAFDVLELAGSASSRGLGRVGFLRPPRPFGEFVTDLAAALPATPAGIRAAGDPDRPVERVAVCGGAGDSLLPDAVRSGADVYVTGDLRHHPASDALDDGPMLVDVGHWASEWLWLPDGAQRLASALARRGQHVETRVSTIVTDPWTLQVPTLERAAGSLL